MYALVLLMYESKTLDKVFTYKIPSFLSVKKGLKVKVPFNNKEINGIVLDIIDKVDETFNIKEIISIVNDDIYFTDELIDLAYKLKELTICSLSTAFKTMVPSRLKLKSDKNSLAKYDYKKRHMDFILKSFPSNIKHEDIVDLNGAGDAFLGGFLSQYMQGKSFEACCKAGNDAAGIIIRNVGCSFPKHIKIKFRD